MLTIVYYGSSCVLEKFTQLRGRVRAGHVPDSWRMLGDEAVGRLLGCVR
jgi:hypothetical protein